MKVLLVMSSLAVYLRSLELKSNSSRDCVSPASMVMVSYLGEEV